MKRVVLLSALAIVITGCISLGGWMDPAPPGPPAPPTTTTTVPAEPTPEPVCSAELRWGCWHRPDAEQPWAYLAPPPGPVCDATLSQGCWYLVGEVWVEEPAAAPGRACEGASDCDCWSLIVIGRIEGGVSSSRKEWTYRPCPEVPATPTPTPEPQAGCEKEMPRTPVPVTKKQDGPAIRFNDMVIAESSCQPRADGKYPQSNGRCFQSDLVEGVTLPERETECRGAAHWITDQELVRGMACFRGVGPEGAGSYKSGDKEQLRHGCWDYYYRKVKEDPFGSGNWNLVAHTGPNGEQFGTPWESWFAHAQCPPVETRECLAEPEPPEGPLTPSECSALTRHACDVEGCPEGMVCAEYTRPDCPGYVLRRCEPTLPPPVVEGEWATPPLVGFGTTPELLRRKDSKSNKHLFPPAGLAWRWDGTPMTSKPYCPPGRELCELLPYRKDATFPLQEGDFAWDEPTKLGVQLPMLRNAFVVKQPGEAWDLADWQEGIPGWAGHAPCAAEGTDISACTRGKHLLGVFAADGSGWGVVYTCDPQKPDKCTKEARVPNPRGR